MDAGALELMSGVGEYTSGVGALSSGIGEVDAGAVGLKDGLDALNDKSASLKSGSEVLKAGAANLDTGLTNLKTGVSTIQQIPPILWKALRAFIPRQAGLDQILPTFRTVQPRSRQGAQGLQPEPAELSQMPETSRRLCKARNPS